MFAHINPTNDRTLYEIPVDTEKVVEEKLEASSQAQRKWRKESLQVRLSFLARLATEMESSLDGLAHTATREMGKPIEQSRAEVRKCISTLKYVSHAANLPPLEQKSQLAGFDGSIHAEPLGPILGIMPWNFPFWQVIRFATAPLAVGNSILIKHAPNTMGSQKLLQEMFDRAGFPKGVMATLLVGVDSVAKIIADSRVRGVSLTGSARAGRAVGAAAGQALKKSVLELGGSDAYIVLADADLDRAVKACVDGRLVNSGQSCLAAKRFIIEAPVFNKFRDLFVEQMSKISFDDPEIETTRLGPLARKDLRDDLERQVQASLRLGANLLCGGKLPHGPGCFYPATVLSEVRPGQAAFDEELFGPVAALIEASDAHEALRLANLSRYGLGSAIFTNDISRAKRMAKELEAGLVFVNDFVRSDVSTPFGGVKDSGYGRELGTFGFYEFANVQSFCVSSFK